MSLPSARLLPLTALAALFWLGCAGGEEAPIKENGRCGDGIRQEHLGEECDDGNLIDGDGCSSACKIELAGTETNCTNGLDDDGDTLVDCLDPDCFADPACLYVGGETICDDGIDNDRDGHTDCEDADCEGRACGPNGESCQGGICLCWTGYTAEVDCTNGLDDDCDGLTDCFDPDCFGNPACAGTETICDDGLDNDNDTLTDCADPDCDAQVCGSHGRRCADAACVCPGGATETQCADGQDNDCDGLVDCDDPDCTSAPNCATEETICDDGKDNDNDTLTDCQDPDCNGRPCGAHGRVCSGGACTCPGGNTETQCADGNDNDCDGLIDCEDPDCFTAPGCTETVCDDGLDNDGDTLVDCLDPDCNNRPCGLHGKLCSQNQCRCPGGTTETLCGDGLDNDCDGLVDCQDPDCAAFPACIPAAICETNRGMMFCGVQDETTTVGGSSTVNSYSCHGAQESGPERIYSFFASTNSSVTVALTGLSADLDLMIMPEDTAGNPDCNPNNCTHYSAASGTSNESVTFTATAGQNYFIAVDGKNGASGNYRLDVNCSGGSGCAAGWLLTCDDFDEWNNSAPGSTNNITSYHSSCSASLESGPEYTYIFAPGRNGTANITMVHDTGDLDLFLLDFNGGVCGSSAPCVRQNTGVSRTVEILNVPIATNDLFFLVVDGYNGSTSDYLLEITCN